MDKYISLDAAKEAVVKAVGKGYSPFNAIVMLPTTCLRPVVTCSDCKWWTKQEASLQGRCELLQMYPTGAWFCANGVKREES